MCDMLLGFLKLNSLTVIVLVFPVKSQMGISGGGESNFTGNNLGLQIKESFKVLGCYKSYFLNWNIF